MQDCEKSRSTFAMRATMFSIKCSVIWRGLIKKGTSSWWVQKRQRKYQQKNNRKQSLLLHTNQNLFFSVFATFLWYQNRHRTDIDLFSTKDTASTFRIVYHCSHDRFHKIIKYTATKQCSVNTPTQFYLSVTLVKLSKYSVCKSIVNNMFINIVFNIYNQKLDIFSWYYALPQGS